MTLFAECFVQTVRMRPDGFDIMIELISAIVKAAMNRIQYKLLGKSRII